MVVVFCFVIISVLSVSTVSTQDDIIIEGEELPPRTRVTRLDTIFPEFTIDDDNVSILDKIINGDNDLLKDISRKKYVELLDLMAEYRYYVLSNFQPNNDMGIKDRAEVTLYYIFNGKYEQAFIAFAYALYNPDEEIAVNAYIHFRKLSEIIEPSETFITPLKKIFFANMENLESKKIKALHMKAILTLQRIEFLLVLKRKPELLSSIDKDKFRLIYEQIDEDVGRPPFFSLDDDDVNALLHGLNNNHLSIVYACLSQLKRIYTNTASDSVKDRIKANISILEKRIEKYDLYLGGKIYDMSSDFK